jgi:hypothetical protein
MNTYNIEVNGITLQERINPEDLDKTLIQVRGLVWTSGGKNEDIKVVLNSGETHCND